MISQAQSIFENRLLNHISYLKVKNFFLKIAYAVLLMNLTFTTDSHAAQRKDFLFNRSDEAFQRPLQEIEVNTDRNGLRNQRNTREDYNHSSRININTLLFNVHLSPPLPTLRLPHTAPELIEEHLSAVPVIKSPPQRLMLTVNNNFYKSAVGNQLQLGTCASFAVVDALLYLHGKSLSPAYLNVKAKSQYAFDCANNGLNIGLAMKCAFEYGTVMDWIWPYKGYYTEVEESNKNISNEPQPNWDVCVQNPYSNEEDEGLVKFAFGNVKSLFLTDVKSQRAFLIRDALITYKAPIIISIPVQWNNEWLPNLPTTGKIKSPLTTIKGWHAISICGFNDSSQEFIFKNSWGLEWGNQGFGTMAYSYVIQHANEAWLGYGIQLKA